MGYSYARLTSQDAPLLKELLRVFGEAFEDVGTYQDAPSGDAYLESLLAKDHFIALVAQGDDKVVGGLAAYVLEKCEQERKEIYLYDLAVLSDHRRNGIATALIQRLRLIGKQQGAYVIFVQADKGDVPAIGLYESFGTREDVCHFDIPVD